MTVTVSNGTSGTALEAPVVIVASGDTTGATDVANINAALTAGNLVKGVSGSTYYINAPIYLRSSTGLDMTGCTIHLASGVLLNMIRNKAVDVGTTATDGATASGSAVLTSVTLAATAQVGNAIQVVGAGYGGAGGSSWYGTVTAVNSGTHHITLSVNAQTTIASGATCYLYTSRDTDITLTGGLWLPTDLSAGTTPLTNFVTCFRRVDRVTVSNMTFTQPGSAGVGGAYNLSFGDATELSVDGIHFTSTAGDGVHVFGPSSRVRISNISGKTGDDFVAISSGWNEAQVSDTQGDVTNVVCEGLYPNGAASACVIVGFDTSSLFKMQGITVRSVHGTTSATSGSTGFGVYALASGSVSDVLVEDVVLATASSNPCVAFGSSAQALTGTFQNVTVRDVTWKSSAVASQGIVSLNAPGGDFRVENVTMGTSPSGSSVGVWLGANTVASVAASGIRSYGAPTIFYGVQCTGGTIGDLTITDVDLSGSNWAVLYESGSGTAFTNGIALANIFAATGSGQATLSIGVGTSAYVVRATNLQISGYGLIYSFGPVTLEVTNADFNVSTAVVSVSGAPASPARIQAQNCTLAGGGTTFARDASQLLSLNGNCLPTDLSLLTPTEGDIVRNSNGALACGVGIVAYAAASTGHGWKQLVTGSTY